MKKINRSSWHARTYSWWHGHKHGWPCERSVNLCPYIRAVLFWAPARFLFLHGKLKYFTWLVLGLLGQLELAKMFGWRRLLLAELHVFGFILAVALGTTALFGSIWLYKKTGETETLKSFTEVLVERYKSAHKHVCPEVEFEENSLTLCNHKDGKGVLQ